ncbi:hypothetical protein [Clostridioides difficile]|uniref:hypothetical protein n=1 Tax=Clostridioides difficile TaxID=1496 RepID=UPI001304DD22|nr:hypothetical protein [Clostridioides difficile]
MIHDFRGKLLINENFNFEKSFCGDWYSFYTWVVRMMSCSFVEVTTTKTTNSE